MRNEKGFGLLQVTLALGGMMGFAFVMNEMGNDNMKSVSAMEFKMMMEQVRSQTTGYISKNSKVCKCLLSGIEFDRSPSGKISDAGTSTANKLGIYSSDCSSVSSPILTTDYGVGEYRLKKIRLLSVENLGGGYKGKLTVDVQTKKKVMSSDVRSFQIPVAISIGDGSSPSKVKLTGCSIVGTPGESEGSIFKAVSADDPGAKITLNPSSGNFSFPAVPATASGIFVQYTIGSPANKRGDRNCTILGSEMSMLIGNDSKGDGGQRFVAGSAYVPLDGCATPMTYSCINKNNRGEFRVVAYIDDGNPPTCAGAQFGCTSGTVPDGIGGCVVPDGSVGCPAGHILDEENGNCVVNPNVTCATNQVAVQGVCQDVSSVAAAKAEADAKKKNPPGTDEDEYDDGCGRLKGLAKRKCELR